MFVAFWFYFSEISSIRREPPVVQSCLICWVETHSVFFFLFQTKTKFVKWICVNRKKQIFHYSRRGSSASLWCEIKGAILSIVLWVWGSQGRERWNSKEYAIRFIRTYSYPPIVPASGVDGEGEGETGHSLVLTLSWCVWKPEQELFGRTDRRIEGARNSSVLRKKTDLSLTNQVSDYFFYIFFDNGESATRRKKRRTVILYPSLHHPLPTIIVSSSSVWFSW